MHVYFQKVYVYREALYLLLAHFICGTIFVETFTV